MHTQNNIQTYIVKRVLTTCLSLTLGSLLMLSACTMPGGNQKISKIRLSIQNTLPIKRKNVPIILTGYQLRKVNPDFSFKAYSVVTGKAPREVMIPAQADDLDYDGERDQLCFLIDLAEEETKEVSILYDPTVKATLTLDINKQTRAAIFPELDAVAAMESNLIAYLLKSNGAFTAYGKKRVKRFSMDAMFQTELDQAALNKIPLPPELRQHFESNDISLSQQVQIETQKPEQQWVVRDLENQETYFIRKSYGSEVSDLGQKTQMDGELNVVESIGLSLNALLNPETTEMIPLNASEGLIGCGGIALWDKEKAEMIPLPADGNYVRILADGSIRSIVQRIVPEWNIEGETRRLTSTTFIYGENPWIEHHIHIDGNLPTGYAIATGIPNLKGTNKEDKEQGWIWSWGTDPRGKDTLGVALIAPTGRHAQDTNRPEKDDLLPVILTPNADGRLNYRTFAIWGGGIDGIEMETEFADHVQRTTTVLKTPPLIKFLPKAEEK